MYRDENVNVVDDFFGDFNTEYAEKTKMSSGKSCATPGNPYMLHCFPVHKTDLTFEHREHLDRIASKIVRSFQGSQPIRHVNIIGHAATWRGITKSEYGRRALIRAKNTQAQLRGRLANVGLGGMVDIKVGHRADNEPLANNMINSSSTAAQNNRALNRRVEITLTASGGGVPVVEPPLKNISRVWIFGTANQLMTRGSFGDKWRQRVVDHGFTDVAIFVNGKPKKNYVRGKQENENYKYNLHFRNNDKIRETRKFFEKVGIDIHLVTWIKPTKRYIEGCAKVTLPLCEKIGARSLMFDAEEPWHGSLRKLQLTQEQSKRIVEKYFCHSFGDHPCCLGVTHIAGDPRNDGIKKTVGPLVQACDYSLPQAYTSTTNKKDRCVKKPGCLQKRAAKKWSTINRTIVMGLRTKSPTRKAWEQDIKITDGINIMSSTPFVASHIQEVAYWWLPALGSRERRKFFKSLNSKARVVRSMMSDEDKLNSDLFLCPPLLRCKR